METRPVSLTSHDDRGKEPARVATESPILVSGSNRLFSQLNFALAGALAPAIGEITIVFAALCFGTVG
ncbi:hypothetical protein H6P81_002766 [Aristolochia fimbriata]|uniref:MFS transporter n=1 Tax=Aristolochia fimbriata TaxID=158543 RepID=A0AAV7FAX8_ARIFI|nr:hypothetical protein H6P81_002766 [Aristolochia fimbriata]